MKTTKAILAMMVALAVSALADTTVTVSDVTAKQRYPWNGLVDIDCTVSGIDGETNGLRFAVAAMLPDTGLIRSVSHVRVVRDDAAPDDREVCTNGTYRLLWDARADFGLVRFTNLVVRITFDAHRRVQLWERGPYWATTNVGAEKPWEYGCYFWWGDTVGYRREGNAWVACDGSSAKFSFSLEKNTPTYHLDCESLNAEGWITSEGVLVPEHDAAQVHWGGEWRMPTYEELYDLCCTYCDWTWTTQNGVNGYVVRGRGDFSSAWIFLPAAGWGDETKLRSIGSYCYYWSSVPYLNRNSDSWYLYFFQDNHSTYHGSRCDGFLVRPVQSFTE